jgi:hypothetical protein
MHQRRWKKLGRASAAVLAGVLALAAALQAAPRNLRTFLPKSGEAIQEPAAQIVQLLLDRQDQEDRESYMVQVLFRGKPAAEHSVRIYDDRVEIDFYDTAKPSMRLAKIRGGAVEASALEELFYRAPHAVGAKVSARPAAKRLVRLTLFVHGRPDLKLRDTLDRTLIHFRLPKPAGRDD